jgi:hypothetical protein
MSLGLNCLSVVHLRGIQAAIDRGSASLAAARAFPSQQWLDATGDHYTAAWVSSAWTKHGITYRQVRITAPPRMIPDNVMRSPAPRLSGTQLKRTGRRREAAQSAELIR